MNKIYDVIIIGGGPGGLAAALTLARGGREVLVFDNGNPRNAPAKHMQNVLAHDGTPPTEYKKFIMKDLEKYKNLTFIQEKVKTISLGFIVITDNQKYQAKKLVLAHGIQDILPDIPGFKELWGKSIFHCPYCHGHEHRDEAMGLIGDSKYAFHMAPLLKGLTNDLIWFSNGEKIENPEMMEKNGIKVFESKIKELSYRGEKLKSIILENNEEIERQCLFGFFPRVLNSNLGVELGCELTEDKIYKVTDTFQTNIQGVYAVGDIAQRMQSVSMAASSGQLAGAMINFELLNEDFKK